MIHKKVMQLKRNIDFVVNSLQTREGLSIENLESALTQLNDKHFLKSSNFMTVNILDAL